jgi:hypothetical protein
MVEGAREGMTPYDPEAAARSVVEELMSRAAAPHTGSYVSDAKAWPSAGIESSDVVTMLTTALTTAYAAGYTAGYITADSPAPPANPVMPPSRPRSSR